jgi:hypothetical protein
MATVALSSSSDFTKSGFQGIFYIRTQMEMSFDTRALVHPMMEVLSVKDSTANTAGFGLQFI